MENNYKMKKKMIGRSENFKHGHQNKTFNFQRANSHLHFLALGSW